MSNLVSRCGYLLTCLRTMSKGNNDIQIDGLKRSLILINNKGKLVNLVHKVLRAYYCMGCIFVCMLLIIIVILEGSDLKERCYELKEIVTSTLNILSSSIQNESNIYSGNRIYLVILNV